MPGGCTPSFHPPEFRILFQVPYALGPLFATLTKTAGVVVLLTKNPHRKTLDSSHSGTRSWNTQSRSGHSSLATAPQLLYNPHHVQKLPPSRHRDCPGSRQDPHGRIFPPARHSLQT